MATQTQTAPNNAHAVALKDGAESKMLDEESMRCPDPSAHKTKDSALQDQASAAALYTNLMKATTGNPLGPDGKLSSASAATSLKKALAHELPSFPIVGTNPRSSAGTAATLANAHTKSPEWWKPEQSAAAGKAALLANDYKMAPLWHPEASAAGSKAALLAHKDGGKVNLWTPEASSYGNSAASIAMRKKSGGREAIHETTDEDKKKALVAATGAVLTSGRKRAQSTPASPPLFPDAENSARNALNAATIAHSPSIRAPKTQSESASTEPAHISPGAMEAARIQHAKVNREMYTDRPPVLLEVEEKRHQDALKASALSMAKKMYDVQQHYIDQAAGRTSRSHAQTGATAAQNQQPRTSDEDIKEQAMRYIGIQEAAQKLAAERLAKVSPDENAAFRSYYGYEKPSRSKLSIRRGRNRASSNPETIDADDYDEFQSRRIRSQMTQLNKSLAEVDAKKREQDRKYLLAAAERKVQAQMLGLDKKIFDETGKMSPAMIEEWDAKARAKAAANSEGRMEHHGKVHIGHGRYMDQADIDAVAQARIQPTLDEITEKTEKRRAEEEEQRLEMQEKKRQAEIEKERAAELKAEEKRAKEEEKKALKAKSSEGRAAAKQEKEAEREKRAEEKRMAKEEKRKLRDVAKGAQDAQAIDSALAAADGTHENGNDDLYREPTRNAQDATTGQEVSSPTSPTSPKSESKGIKSLLNRFKRRSKPSATASEGEKPSFIGGAALRNSERSNQDSNPYADQTLSNDRRFSDVSSLSSAESSDRSPTRTTTRQSGMSGASEYEEARDDFDEDLAPPPAFTTTAAGRMGSPNRDSKFHEVGL